MEHFVFVHVWCRVRLVGSICRQATSSLAVINGFSKSGRSLIFGYVSQNIVSLECQLWSPSDGVKVHGSVLPRCPSSLTQWSSVPLVTFPLPGTWKGVVYENLLHKGQNLKRIWSLSLSLIVCVMFSQNILRSQSVIVSTISPLPQPLQCLMLPKPLEHMVSKIVILVKIPVFLIWMINHRHVKLILGQLHTEVEWMPWQGLYIYTTCSLFTVHWSVVA